MDVYRSERTGELTVVAELPGVDPSRIQIYADERTLVISGERRRPSATGRVYQQMEIGYGRFQRQIALAEDIDVQACKAAYRRGVLTITMPVSKRPSGARPRLDPDQERQSDRALRRRRSPRRGRAPVDAPGPAAQGHGRLPGLDAARWRSARSARSS